MQKDQLVELRNKIAQSAQELALKGEGSVEDRLQILMSIIRGGDASLEVLTKAFELAESIQNDDDKLGAMLDLLYEVDARLVDIDEQPSEQPAPEVHTDRNVQDYTQFNQ